MTIAGWIVFISAVTGMTGLLLWCIHRVVKTPDAEEHLHSPVDIDTHDD
ncbi:MAG: hypothetical protein JJU29_20205 [Verrucomicrobia bacterium]|nr:hypothetical protein [Verrucomicrobiota bacterium]MCH8511670.1 hypothetical protein [Kiritimatiellia bacterium]